MPSFNRRTFLAGGAALGGVIGSGTLLPASFLPDAVVAWRLRFWPVPDVSARPPITDGHESAARASLRSSIERAEQTWSRVEDQSAANEELGEVTSPELLLRSARSYLENAEAKAGWHALHHAKIGAQYAGEALGGARLAREETSGEQLAEQARDIQRAVADERDRVAYEVTDPSAGLARLYWVEKWLVSAFLNSHRDGTYFGQDEPTTQYDDYDIVRTWGTHLQARRSRADAARLYDDFRAGSNGEWRDVTDHVERADEQLLAEADERTFTHDEFERRSSDLESFPEGPYRSYRWSLVYYVQNADVQHKNGLATGVPVYRAVKNAETVLRARAFEAIRGDERLSKGTDPVPQSLLDRAKRDGLSLFKKRLGAARNRPVLELLLREGRRLLWAGGEELKEQSDRPHSRARAYAKFRLAAEYLREAEAVASILDQPTDG